MGFARLSASVLKPQLQNLLDLPRPEELATGSGRCDISGPKSTGQRPIDWIAPFCLESQAIFLRVPQTAGGLLDFPHRQTAWSIVCCCTKPRIEGDIYEALEQWPACFHHAIRKCLFLKFFGYLRQGANSGKRAFQPVGGARSFAVGRCCSAATAAEDELASHQPRRSSAGQEGPEASEKGSRRCFP
jgi:hypothetical protein